MSDAHMVKCWFYIRHPSAKQSGAYRYERVWLDGPPMGQGSLVTVRPPLMDDIVFLRDKNAGIAGAFRVIARSWDHSQYGSTDWPLGKSAPEEPPVLQLLVEAAEGLFRNEEPDDEEVQQ